MRLEPVARRALIGWPVRTWVMGHEVYRDGQFITDRMGHEAQFDHARGGYWATHGLLAAYRDRPKQTAAIIRMHVPADFLLPANRSARASPSGSSPTILIEACARASATV